MSAEHRSRGANHLDSLYCDARRRPNCCVDRSPPRSHGPATRGLYGDGGGCRILERQGLRVGSRRTARRQAHRDPWIRTSAGIHTDASGYLFMLFAVFLLSLGLGKAVEV